MMKQRVPTVSEIKVVLFAHFQKNTTFLLEDYKEFVTISEEPELTKRVIEVALDDLIKEDVVASVDFRDEGKTRKCWVLKKSLHAYGQQCPLSANTILFLSAIFSKLNELSQVKYDFDPFNITEKNIQEIAIILGGFLNGGEDKGEQPPKEDEV